MKDYKYSLDIMRQELNNKYISPEIKNAFEASIEALEKQMPKTVVRTVVRTETSSQACPICKCSVNWKYCPNCGQRIKY